MLSPCLHGKIGFSKFSSLFISKQRYVSNSLFRGNHDETPVLGNETPFRGDETGFLDI